MQIEKAMEILYAAHNAEIGVIVSSEDPVQLRGHLYSARKRIADPDLDILTFTISPVNPQGELWIIRKELKNGE